MGKTWVISDTHFNHTNIIKYTNRPFKDVNHMNESMIESWNAKVSTEDDVIHCGDFCFGNPRPIIDRLNGRITLVKGNHDKDCMRMVKNDNSVELQNKFRIVESLGLYSMDKRVLFYHYPLWQDRYTHIKVQNHYEWEILLYGHLHNSEWDIQGPSNTKNVCVEKMNYEPQELDLVVQSLL